VQERVIRVHNILGTADQVEATSGGTESILMSVKTHRDWAKSVKGITKPEMYVSVLSWHALMLGFQGHSIICSCCILESLAVFRDKATCHTCQSGDEESGCQLDEEGHVSRPFICSGQSDGVSNPNTIMIVGSAPNFPDGIVVRSYSN
jgi:sphinganine-1-phosphate aldolase